MRPHASIPQVAAADAIAGVPKAELHCHMGLAIDAAMLRTAQQRGVALPFAPEDLEARLPVRDWAHFGEINDFMRPLRSPQWPGLYALFMQLHIERLRVQNVRYTEIAIGLPLRNGIPPAEAEWRSVYGSFRAIADAHCGPEMRVEFVGSLWRSDSAEAFAVLVPSVIRMFEEGLIVGIQFVGEESHPIRPFQRSIAELREAGVGIEIHAGEFLGAASVREALTYGRPDRIGHGLGLFDDPELLAHVRDEQIHVELCPTSNVRTGAVASLEAHPLRRALDLGLNFSINTDDPGIFGCSLESEYRLATDAFGFTVRDLEGVTENAIRSRFRRHGES